MTTSRRPVTTTTTRPMPTASITTSTRPRRRRLAQPMPAAQPATGLAAEWLDLFPRLGLSGMTGSIGANCTLVEANGDDWLLHLDPAHSALFNATQQRRLNEALNQHLGRSLNLRIELLRPEQETPAQAAARKRAERQRLAEASSTTIRWCSR